MQPIDILKTHWGHASFRPLQEEIIASVLAKKDTLALLPTGGGKSICFQVPTLLQPGLCLVISPLIALMKDQVEQLRKKNITAYALYAGMGRKEVMQVLETAGQSNCKFLYVSPERLGSSLFTEYLPSLDIQLVAVDEAHCISQWGYDFRPSYLRIAAIKEQLPGVPLLALTASATPAVQQDIIEKLELQQPAVFRQSFARPQLSYSVFKVAVAIEKIVEILQKVKGSSIIYCRSRIRTQEIAEQLIAKGIHATWYHAGLDAQQRQQRQEDWQQDRCPVMVCTNAFGMGIDKPDVRTVIHAGIPDCLENYYQEAGRAGRDGKRAYAVLLYTPREWDDLQTLSALRFPSLDEIKKVYQAIANYLQLPVGAGGGQYFDFDSALFAQRFSIKTHTLLYALKALEQEGWVTYNEQVFVPSQVQCIADRSVLEELERSDRTLDALCKTLLRHFQGILDRPVSVSEKQVGYWLQQEAAVIEENLMRLQQKGIIRYQKKKEDPQLFFPVDRIPAADLSMDEPRYRERKKTFEQSVGSMLSYVNAATECRSMIIGAYFGDDRLPRCGICDNCLQQKQKRVSADEFGSLQQRIVSVLQQGPTTIAVLLQQLSAAEKEKAPGVIDYLRAEEKIRVDRDGMLHCL